MTNPYENGFTYLGVLFAVSIIGAGLASAGTVGSVAAQRQKEIQLLFVGESFRNAIRSYYFRGPAGVRQYPRSLEDLLEDRRSGQLQRHLRKIYLDPVTNSVDWSLITTADGGIIGVSSSSSKRPIKRANFSAQNRDLTDAQCYCAWRFVFLPQLD